MTIDERARQVICHGSCRVAGHQTSAPPLTAWPGQLGLLLGSDWRVITNGIGSLSIRELDAQAVSTVDGLLTPDYSLNVLLLDELTCTLAAHDLGSVVSETIADLRCYCANRRAAAEARGANLKIGVMLCPAGSPNQRELLRREINAVLLLVGAQSLGCDLLWGSDLMTSHDAYKSHELYNADALHPSEVGHVHIARAAYEAVRNLESMAC